MLPSDVPFGAAFRVHHCLHIVVGRDFSYWWLIGAVQEDEWAAGQCRQDERVSIAPRGLSVRGSIIIAVPLESSLLYL